MEQKTLESGTHAEAELFEEDLELLLGPGEHRFDGLFRARTILRPADGTRQWHASVNAAFGCAGLATDVNSSLTVDGLMIRGGLHGIKAQGRLAVTSCLFYGCPCQAIQSNAGGALIAHSWFYRCGYARRWEHACYLFGGDNLVIDNVFDGAGYLAITMARATSAYAAGGGWILYNLMHRGGRIGSQRRGIVELGEPERTGMLHNTIEGEVFTYDSDGTYRVIVPSPTNLLVGEMDYGAVVSREDGIYWPTRDFGAGCYAYDERRTRAHAADLWRGGHMGVALGEVIRLVLPMDAWDLAAARTEGNVKDG